MNENRVVGNFIAGLSVEIRYRIGNDHSSLDDAVREAFLVHDEKSKKRFEKSEKPKDKKISFRFWSELCSVSSSESDAQNQKRVHRRRKNSTLYPKCVLHG